MSTRSTVAPRLHAEYTEPDGDEIANFKLRREWFEQSRTAINDAARGAFKHAALSRMPQPALAFPRVLAGRADKGWVSIGPNNVTGRVKSLALHPTDRKTMIVGTANGGVWVTRNGGARWRAMMQREPWQSIGAVAIAPSSPDVIYAGTGEDTPGFGPSYGGNGVYISVDGGQSWRLSGGTIGSYVNRILVHKTNPRIVHAATDTGFHKSIDGGTTWTTLFSGHISDAIVHPLSDFTFMIGAWNDGLYFSDSGGAQWFKRHGVRGDIIADGARAGWIKLAVAENPQNLGAMRIAAKCGSDSRRIYYSEDSGASWRLIGAREGGEYSEWASLIALHPNMIDRIWAGGVGLQYGVIGRGWGPAGGTHADHHQMVFDPVQKQRCYVATDGGVFASVNTGRDFALASFGIRAAQLYSVGVSQTEELALGCATQDQGIIAFVANDAWRDTKAGNEGGIYVVDPDNAKISYATPWGEGLSRSMDGARTWRKIQRGMRVVIQGRASEPPVVYDLAVHPRDGRILLAATTLEVKDSKGALLKRVRRLYRSVNRGGDWTSVVNLPADPSCVAFAPSNAQTAYATDARGNVYRSADAGLTWRRAHGAGGAPAGARITALAIAPDAPRELFVGIGDYSASHVFRSTDGGATWTDATGAAGARLPDLPVNDLLIDPANRNVIFAATDNGVYRSDDSGAHWIDFSVDVAEGMLPAVIVTGLALRARSRELYVSTFGRGAYKRVIG